MQLTLELPDVTELPVWQMIVGGLAAWYSFVAVAMRLVEFTTNYHVPPADEEVSGPGVWWALSPVVLCVMCFMLVLLGVWYPLRVVSLGYVPRPPLATFRDVVFDAWEPRNPRKT